jgi:hypothetical protein
VTDRRRVQGNQIASKNTGAAIPTQKIGPKSSKMVSVLTTSTPTPKAVVAAARPNISIIPAMKQQNNHAASVVVSTNMTNNATRAVHTNGKISIFSTTKLTKLFFQLQGLPASVTVMSNNTTVTRPTTILNLQPMAASPIAANKKVIDIVDLSDEDDGAPPPMAMQAQNNGLRLVPTNQLRGNTIMVNNGVAKLGTGSYTLQGATLVPVPRPPGITTVVKILNHPAPLPSPPKFQHTNPLWKAMPPKPTLKISRLNTGIIQYIKQDRQNVSTSI